MPSSPYGYHGAYLRIQLSSKSAQRVVLQENALRSFVGGSGLGTYLLLREQVATADPLAEQAALVFVFSPLVGSPLTTSAKFAVVCKSPLTDRLNDSLASSGFAIAGKRTGFDAVVVTGRLDQLSVLTIDNGEVDFHAAADLAGLQCDETEQLLRTRFGDEWRVASIGPAGERGVHFATVSHDGRHAARGGTGAVLGSKNIKAILVRGTQRTEWAHPTELVKLSKSLSQRSFGPATAKYRELGTASNLLVFNRLRALPTRNFQQGSFSGVEHLAPETLSTTRNRTRAYCDACTIGCEHIYALRDSQSDNDPGVRLEYENLFALGPLCGINHAETVLQASRRCDELGIDTISTGGTIAFAMECVEKGMLEASWLRFGEPKALLQAIELIGARRDLGSLMSLGSRQMAKQIGQNSIEFAPQVKGLEIPGYEPRALQTMALGFAVGTRGADHNRSGAYEVDFSGKVDRRGAGPESAIAAVDTENRAAVMDSLILCKFLRGVFDDFYAETAEMLNLVTGWDTTAAELELTAERIVAAKKIFNVRAGWKPDEDCLPARFLQEELGDDSKARLTSEQLASLVTAYNQARGWTDEGYVESEQLLRLGLDTI